MLDLGLRCWWSETPWDSLPAPKCTAHDLLVFHVHDCSQQHSEHTMLVTWQSRPCDAMVGPWG